MQFLAALILLQTFCISAFAFAENNSVAPNASDQWIESALKSNAAHDQQWLRLGHWKKRGPIGRQFRSEYLSEADGPALFLAPNGKTDPRAELEATLRAFFSPPTAKPTITLSACSPRAFNGLKPNLKLNQH